MKKKKFDAYSKLINIAFCFKAPFIKCVERWFGRLMARTLPSQGRNRSSILLRITIIFVNIYYPVIWISRTLLNFAIFLISQIWLLRSTVRILACHARDRGSTPLEAAIAHMG